MTIADISDAQHLVGATETRASDLTAEKVGPGVLSSLPTWRERQPAVSTVEGQPAAQIYRRACCYLSVGYLLTDANRYASREYTQRLATYRFSKYL